MAWDEFSLLFNSFRTPFAGLISPDFYGFVWLVA